MTSQYALTIGQWIEFEDEQHQIAGFADTCIRLRSRAGGMQLIMAAALLADPSFRHRPSTSESTEPDTQQPGSEAMVRQGWDQGALWDELSETERDAVLEIESHLLELETGYRRGEPDPARPEEPRPEYHPDLRIEERVAAKATETGYSQRRIWQLLKGYREHGVFELVDKRKLRGRNPLARLDPRIIEAVREQASYEEFDSTGTLNRFRRRVQNRLDAAHGPGAVALPSDSTFRRAVILILPGRYTFGLAKTRQTTANKPDSSYSHLIAHRPGELVMIDTSWLDVHAYDPITDQTFPCEITVALDLYTRSLLAWRITPLGTKGIDIGLLVCDAMTPEPMRAGWPHALKYSMLRIPEERLLKIDQRLAAAAGRPVIYPETILVDHGKPYQSDVVRRACNTLGISFPVGRKGKPTDKPEVEAVFRTIRTQFSEHVAGYKGSDVARRGRDPQAHVRWTIPELEEFFSEYVVAVYQQRWHEGLVVPGYPAERLSPNQAYELGIELAGYVTCPSDPTLYFQLLPIAKRKISDIGVRINHLTYTDDEGRLFKYRNSSSPYRDGLWPVRYDPRNLLHAYFHDPFDDRWILLRWTHSLDEHQPFTDTTLREVTRLITDRQHRKADQEDIAAALVDLQNRMDAPESWTSTDRRRAARDADRARVAARDRHRAVAAATGTPHQDRIPDLRVVAATPEPSDIDLDDLDLPDVEAAPTWKSTRQEHH